MAITQAGTGTVQAGTGTRTPSYPAGVAAGRIAILKVISKQNAGTGPVRPLGWLNLVAPVNGGTGTQGVDTGLGYVAVFYRILDGSESGTVSVTFTSANNNQAVIDIYSATNGFDIAKLAGSTGADATHGTAWSATMGATLTFGAGDFVVGCSYNCSNSTTDNAITSRALTATGATFGAVANTRNAGSSSANDSQLDTFDFPVSTGPASAAAVYTGTHAANNSGITALVRLVENPSGFSMHVLAQGHANPVTSAWTTPSFDPPDSSMLFAVTAVMEDNGSQDPSDDLTITDNTGGGPLVWTAVQTIGNAANWSIGHRIWRTPITTGVAMTVSFDAGAVNIYGAGYLIFAVINTDTTTPIGGVVTDSSVAAGADSITLDAAPATTDFTILVAHAQLDVGGPLNPTLTGFSVLTDVGGANYDLVVGYRESSTSTTVAWTVLTAITPFYKAVASAFVIKKASAAAAARLPRRRNAGGLVLRPA